MNKKLGVIDGWRDTKPGSEGVRDIGGGSANIGGEDEVIDGGSVI